MIKEVELPKTENTQDVFDPGWESPIKRFDLGLHNEASSTLSNMIADKIQEGNSSLFKLSDLIMLFDKQYQFILALVDKLIGLAKKGE